MPSDVFLDTNGWLALLNKSELLHAEADRAWRELIKTHRAIVLTDWVIAETGNGLARGRARNIFRPAVDRLLTSPVVVVV